MLRELTLHIVCKRLNSPIKLAIIVILLQRAFSRNFCGNFLLLSLLMLLLYWRHSGVNHWGLLGSSWIRNSGIFLFSLGCLSLHSFLKALHVHLLKNTHRWLSLSHHITHFCRLFWILSLLFIHFFVRIITLVVSLPVGLRFWNGHSRLTNCAGLLELIIALLCKRIQLLMKRAERDGFFSRNLDVARPLIARMIVAFSFLKWIAKAIKAWLLRLLVMLSLYSETRRKVSKVVPKVIHDCPRNHLAGARLLIVQYTRGFTLSLSFILILCFIASCFKLFVFKIPEVRLQVIRFLAKR